jgi:peptidoglycan hydrolase CwlO-like protein
MHGGGYVPKDGFAFLERGEEVISRQGGGIAAPDVRLGQLRRRRERLAERLREIPDRDLSNKEMRKLVKATNDQIAAINELIEQQKGLRQDVKEHNRLWKQVKGNEKAALSAVVDLTANQIGARSAEQRRNAAAGGVVSY